MRIALSLYIVQIFNSVGMAWRSHGSSNADMVQKLKGALQLERYTARTCLYAEIVIFQLIASSFLNPSRQPC